jgi:hypothetical protein
MSDISDRERDNGPQADQPAALMMVEVTNLNDFPIEDYYDGVPIILHPLGKNTVNLRPEQALHCFGYPGEFKDMAKHMSKRYGWNTREYLRLNQERQTLYEELAQKVHFKPIFYDLVQRRPNDPIPALVGPDDDDDDRPQTARADDLDTGTRVGRRKKVVAPKPPRRPREKPQQERSTADVRLGRHR